MKEEEFSSVEDFVFNRSFREWLLENNSVHKAYWENWIKKNPDKLQLLNYAKGIVHALTVKHKQLSEAEVDNRIQSILQKINVATNHEGTFSGKSEPSAKRSIFTLRRVAVAAAFMGLIFLAVYTMTKQHPANDVQAELQQLPSTDFSTMNETVNDSDTIQLVKLHDGSTVQLFASSKLTFASESFLKKREVFLTGEAFFDVKKNASVPFVVFTKDIVAKVLGTSFNVKAYPNENNASVIVRTGKVSVYRKESFSNKTTIANKLDGVIVIPNQQVVYDVTKDQLRKTIIDEPVALSDSLPKKFEFNSTPLKDVFKTLQNTYGINIIYDESVINSCSLSASMGDENFYEKLELICKAINASYESIDGTIFISSTGCN